MARLPAPRSCHRPRRRHRRHIRKPSFPRSSDYQGRSIKRKPFLKLTHPKRYNGAFLGVLLIPADHEQLLELTEDGFASASRMYWEHSSRLGEIGDGLDSKTVRLPRSNLFDVEGLQGIMQRIGDDEGGSW